MPRGKSKDPPKYRHHKARNLAVVTVDGKDHYLGEYGSPESYNKYTHLLAEWRQGVLRAEKESPQRGPDLTVGELTLLYWEHSQAYYSRDGQPNGRTAVVRRAIQAINGSFADLSVSEFGPLKLQVVRQKLIDQKLSRRYINDLACTIVAMFRWAVSQELVDSSVHQALKSVPGLRKGKTTAREGRRVKPVDEAVVENTVEYAPPVIQAMVSLQLLTGARPGEIRSMRRAITLQTDGVWRYRPEHHKTEHHEKERVIFIGPKAQQILQPYLDRDADAYCFPPAESEQDRRCEMRKKRKTPVQPSQRRRQKRNPRRKPGEMYTKDSYCRAIRRACEAAGVPPWTPHQLRHTGGTRVRKKYGVENAQVVLGVSDLNVTEIYAERDHEKAAAIMREIG